jgi:hypothetical protein
VKRKGEKEKQRRKAKKMHRRKQGGKYEAMKW